MRGDEVQEQVECGFLSRYRYYHRSLSPAPFQYSKEFWKTSSFPNTANKLIYLSALNHARSPRHLQFCKTAGFDRDHCQNLFYNYNLILFFIEHLFFLVFTGCALCSVHGCWAHVLPCRRSCAGARASRYSPYSSCGRRGTVWALCTLHSPPSSYCIDFLFYFIESGGELWVLAA